MSKIKHVHSVHRLRELFAYDAETGVLLRRSTGRQTGTLVNTGHLSVWVDGHGVGAHRIAWALLYGEYPLVEIDHANGDGSDNRAANLRLATSSQNNQNRRLSRRNTSGVKGVFRVKGRARPWRVAIRANGVYHISHHADFNDAVKHAQALREHLHGEFARAA